MPASPLAAAAAPLRRAPAAAAAALAQAHAHAHAHAQARAHAHVHVRGASAASAAALAPAAGLEARRRPATGDAAAAAAAASAAAAAAAGAGASAAGARTGAAAGAWAGRAAAAHVGAARPARGAPLLEASPRRGLALAAAPALAPAASRASAVTSASSASSSASASARWRRAGGAPAARRGLAGDSGPAEPVRLRLPEDEAGGAPVTKKITEWYKKDGDAVAQGEPLCEVDAGDVVYDFVSPISGTLVRITAQQGSHDLKGGEVIAFLASSPDHITSVRYEAAREVAEGRVVEHGVDKAGAASGGAAGGGGAAGSGGAAGAGALAPENKLRDWLVLVGGQELAEYEEALRKDGFDSVEAMATLEESDLDDLGVTKKGHRKLLLKAVAELQKKA